MDLPDYETPELPKTYKELTEYLIFFNTHNPYLHNTLDIKTKEIVSRIKLDLPENIKYGIAKDYLFFGKSIFFNKYHLDPMLIKRVISKEGEVTFYNLDEGMEIKEHFNYMEWKSSPYEFYPRPALQPIYKSILFVSKFESNLIDAIKYRPIGDDGSSLRQAKEDYHFLQEHFKKELDSLLPFQQLNINDKSSAEGRILLHAQDIFLKRFNTVIEEAFKGDSEVAA